MFDMRFLDEIREAELETVVPRLPAGGAVLEIGGGTGAQALSLERRGFRVASVDLPSSLYRFRRVFPVVEYDGTRLPFPDRSFDAAYSSNVLEHVTDPAPLHAEIRRVLRPGGRGIHVMPSASWRFFSSLTYYFVLPPKAYRRLAGIPPGPNDLPAAPVSSSTPGLLSLAISRILPPRHGEQGSSFGELFGFRTATWVRHFREHGMTVLVVEPTGIFYTGEMALGPRWPIASRRRAASFLGSAGIIYEVRFDR
jgi:SAM-dependent methyltransferase